MKFFIDTPNPVRSERPLRMRVTDGVTTNPTLISSSHRRGRGDDSL